MFTVSFSLKYIHNSICHEAGSMCRIKGPYSGQRQAVSAELKVRTVYGDRHYVQNYRSV